MADPVRLMREWLHVRSRIGLNPDGSDRYGPDTKSRARIEDSQKRYLNAEGDYAVSEATIYLPPDIYLKPGDHLVLQGGRVCPIVFVHVYKTLDGARIFQQVLI